MPDARWQNRADSLNLLKAKSVPLKESSFVLRNNRYLKFIALRDVQTQHCNLYLLIVGLGFYRFQLLISVSLKRICSHQTWTGEKKDLITVNIRHPASLRRCKSQMKSTFILLFGGCSQMVSLLPLWRATVEESERPCFGLWFCKINSMPDICQYALLFCLQSWNTVFVFCSE